MLRRKFTQRRRVVLVLAVACAAWGASAVLGRDGDPAAAPLTADRSTITVVDIPAGLVLRLTPERVASLVRGTLSDAQIERMSARALWSEVRTIEPNAGLPGPGRDGGPVWVVRARGSFVGRRVPPGAKAIRSRTGYFLINDATGAVFAMGMP